MQLRRLLVLSALALLGGCAAIPLTTMWKMRDMTMERFFAMDPKNLRTAIRVDSREEARDPPKLRIDVVPQGATRPLCYAFSLTPVDPNAPGEPKLETAPPNRRWYTYRLSAAGLDAFERARREVKLKALDQGGGTMSLSVSWNWTDPTKTVPVDAIPFRADLAMDGSDGYFTLFKETLFRPGRGDLKPDPNAAKAPSANDPCPIT
jgi:hypothetical protein